MNNPRPPLLERAAAAIATHPRFVLLVVLALALLAGWGTSTIKIYTARNALFPKQVDVYRRLENFLQKFGAVSELVVVIENGSQEELKQFATELAMRLRRKPEVKTAMERFDPHFVLRHAYLLVEPKQLSQLAGALTGLPDVRAVEGAAGWDAFLSQALTWLEHQPARSTPGDLKTAEQQLALPLFFFKQWQRFLTAQESPESIPWHECVSSGAAQRLVGNGGYFASRDGKTLFLFVKSSSPSEEFDVVAPFVDAVRKTAEDLRSEYRMSGKQAPTVGLTGLPAVTCEEYAALQRDISFILVTAGILVLLLIVFWLRSFKLALLVFVPMGLGLLFSTALTAVFIGHLTMLTSGFTAILFGMGVDYGIFMSSRIVEELVAGRPLVDGIARGVAASGKALITASMATVFVFLALITIPFTGFAELGVVAGMGVFMVMLCTFFIQPALFAVLPPTWKPVRAHHKAHAIGEKSLYTKLLHNIHIIILLFAVVTAGIGAVCSTRISFNYDVLAMLPRNSEAVYYQRKMAEESDFQAETVFFTASNMEDARKLADEAAKLPSVGRVESLTYLFPPDAGARVNEARRIGDIASSSRSIEQIVQLETADLSLENMQQLAALLERAEPLIEDAAEMALSAGHKELLEMLYQLLSSMETVTDILAENPAKAREATERYFRALLRDTAHGVSILKTWTRAEPLQPGELPDQLRERFFADDGTIAVYAFPAQSVYDPLSLDQLVTEVSRVSKDVTGSPVTHQWFSREVIKRLRVSIALGAVLAGIWILLMLRSLRGFSIVFFPLLVGGGWMMGILYLAGIPFNYANIIALPLMVGLSMDYGVWFGYRRLELKDLSPWQVLRRAAQAIMLAAGTTLAGLGAIVLARYQGISLLGTTITIGLCCCLVAALFVAPSLTQVLFRRKDANE
jgi:predicted RND superfamily exporter protein